LQIVVGTLDQAPVRQWATQYSLPTTIQKDGYVIALRDNVLLVYSQLPRGVVYACGYELPRRLKFEGAQLALDIDTLVQEPTDQMRAWCFWTTNAAFLPAAATQYRLNMAWLETRCSAAVNLPNDPLLHPYISPHAAEIAQNNAHTAHDLAIGKSLGMEMFIGGLSSLWQLPQYLYHALAAVHPATIATSYQGGSAWPPYEWQDRAQLCLSSPILRQLYTAMLDEHMAAHPAADGFATGLGYDGYPLGCGCEQCQTYTYADRFRDQVMLAYDVVVKKYHKKLWIWTWVVGGASAIPGYEHYYGWVKGFAEANPQSVILTSFATEGDFNITHRLNPVAGTRGPQDLPNVLIWPEYRGDEVVPAWLVDWMAASLPAYRQQGAAGFTGSAQRPDLIQHDLIQRGELYAFGELTWDGAKTAQQVALDYCQQTFGTQAAPYIAAALRKSAEVIARTLYLPCGARFSGHSHIENDLRVMWDVYTLYDSAPFFLTEDQRQEILQAGAPYAPKVEAALPGLAVTPANISQILREKDEAVAGGEWMIAQAELARPYLAPEVYEQLKTRFTWSRDYARLFRGLSHAFFHLRQGDVDAAAQVLAGADEMTSAMDALPHDGPPFPYQMAPQFGSYPWMITPPWELIESLRAAAQLLSAGIKQRPIGVCGSEETVAALDSLYLPYQRVGNPNVDLSGYSALVLGPAAMQSLAQMGGSLAAWVQNGGRLLLYNPSENWDALPTGWLPGRVETWVCNYPTVQVTQPTHPIVQGYTEIKAEPITRFQATSAQLLAATQYAPFIKS
ncbi:MAG TPA: hypothetical protein VGK81_00110, partial [Anaerolineae bacterium]